MMRRVRRLVESVKSSWFTMKKKRSKKQSKILTVPMIKNAIRSGHTYCSDLAKLFKCKKQKMHYWLKKMEKSSIIKVDVKEGNGKVAVYYKIVEPMVKQGHIQDYIGQKHGQKTYYEDECFASYGIIEYDENFIPDNDWKPNKNVLMKGLHMDDVFVRISNDRTITFVFPKIYGETSKKAHYNLIVKAIESKNNFLKKYPKFRLSNFPTNEGLGQLGTTRLKETINNLNPHLPIKTDDYIIDSTPERGSFEMKVKDDPLKTSEKLQKTVDTIISYPDKLTRIENILEKMIEFQTKRIEGDVLKEIKEIKDFLGMNNKKKKVTPSYVG